MRKNPMGVVKAHYLYQEAHGMNEKQKQEQHEDKDAHCPPLARITETAVDKGGKHCEAGADSTSPNLWDTFRSRGYVSRKAKDSEENAPETSAIGMFFC